MKSFFGGSAVIAATILASSLLLSAKPSIAETLLSKFHKPSQEQSQGSKQDPKPDPAGPSATSATDVTTKAQAEVTSTTTPANESAAGESVTATPVGTATANSAGALTASDSSTTPATPATSYTATAYCLRGRTASGRPVAKGLIAADPRVLPLGTRVRVEAGDFSGEYLVADTGGGVRGKKIDIWTPNTRDAMRFGRRTVKLTVLSYPAKRPAAPAHHRKR